jgi:hypothetical protein
LLLGSLAILAVASVAVALNVLLRGKIYQHLRPESRPRRWVLVFMLLLFTVFAVWFSVWMSWPHSLLARLLTIVFAFVFFIVGMTMKWFIPSVDRYVQGKGWPLR